jgi:cytochrome c oxidase assembly factor CtaG
MFVSSVIVAMAAAYAIGVARLWRHAGVGQGVTRGQTLAFACGWIVLISALLSPLDELAERLFSAHMAQHELLMLVGAPLIAVSSPLVAFMWMLPPGGRRSVMHAVRGRAMASAWSALTSPPVAWLLHGVALWVWHMPALYDAALQSELVHALQHLSFFGTAALFWWGMLHGRYGRIGYGAAVVYVFATAVHSGVLGALLTFSPHVWYPLYDRTTTTLGLTPLEDQQLAGLLMWVPASVIFITGGLYFFAAWLREAGRRTRFNPDSPPRTRRTQRKGLVFSFVSFVSIVVIQSTACSRDPHTSFARSLERAASWSASVQFAAHMARADAVPRAYVHDLLATAADDVDHIAREIDEGRDVDPMSRALAAATCRRLTSLLRDADRAGRIPDERELRDVELMLRASAQTARAAVPPRQTS